MNKALQGSVAVDGALSDKTDWPATANCAGSEQARNF